ncbi:MAG: ATP synthase F1 subunit delta [Candidatus Acidiferrales bacterium]
MSLSVARRYARAFADILFAAGVPAAKQRSEVQNAKQQLAGFASLLAQHAPLRNVLANPAVSREQKRAVLDQLRRPLGLSQLARNFLAVLLDHRRLDLLEAVLAAFDREVYARLGIVPVEVTTAFTLTERHKKLLEQRLAALTGSTVEMRFRENPEILAGVVARLGSTIYDASLRSQLRRLQQHLTAEPR